jgi:hypothetical protein
VTSLLLPLPLPLREMRKAGSRWVGAAALAASHLLCFTRKVLSVVSLSSDGLVGGAFAALSVATRSAHVVSPSMHPLSRPGSSGSVLSRSHSLSGCLCSLSGHSCSLSAELLPLYPALLSFADTELG